MEGVVRADILAIGFVMTFALISGLITGVAVSKIRKSPQTITIQYPVIIYKTPPQDIQDIGH
jgi:hypothetical protein